jgi:uncharacterized protein YqjF (DUF2071 family)
MVRPFLTVRWTNLAIVTYAVPPAVLARYVPPGMELDMRDGRAFLSLVAFQFEDTKVLGVSWPGYRRFPELNLRCYVKRGTERGIVFIREFVGKRLVAWIANRVCREHFQRRPITYEIEHRPDRVAVEMCLDAGERTSIVAVTGKKPAILPAAGSDEHFFLEHRFAFGVDRRGRSTRFEVRHPAWEIYPVQSYCVDLDWSAVYGPEWKIMTSISPCHVMLAAGSGVDVYPMSICQRYNDIFLQNKLAQILAL